MLRSGYDDFGKVSVIFLIVFFFLISYSKPRKLSASADIASICCQCRSPSSPVFARTFLPISFYSVLVFCGLT